MAELRRWRLDATSPYMLHLAADARLARTDYVDDQVWELVPSGVDAPALMLRTRYGGRVQNASIQPVWQYEGREIYIHQAYASPPVVTGFAPGFARAEAEILPELTLTAEYWIMESRAAGARYTLTNSGSAPVVLRLELQTQITWQHRTVQPALITLADGGVALSSGRMPGLEPVIALETAAAGETRLGAAVEIPPGETVSIRWACAGLGSMAGSLDRAQYWLGQDWDAAFAQIAEAARAIPQIETGDSAVDATIAFAYQQLVQSFLRPATHLPDASFVANRRSERGYSRRGDGVDHDRSWSGQPPQLSYLAALAVAPIEPHWAHGVIRNFLSVQAEDGTIDARPGMAGQRQGLLCPPVLARLAWNIYQYTEDITFLEAVFPGLVRFINRWSLTDVDTDMDVMPEYQDERQTGYIFWPTFGTRQAWAQNAEIRQFETPDMIAYILSELTSLAEMGRTLQNPGAYELLNRVTDMQRFLE
ncbi:MAG: hypothetical protein ACOCX3_00915, partial [Chloroflexota bacterium]